MVAKAAHRRAVPVYEARGFRSGETVGALVALARNALWEEFGREVEPLGLNATQAVLAWPRHALKEQLAEQLAAR
jgi:hypothetical protein